LSKSGGLQTIGSIISSIGGIGLGVGILLIDFDYTLDSPQNQNAMYLALGGCLVGLGGIALSLGGNATAKRAINLYNSSLSNTSKAYNLNFGVTPSGGVGLALTF